MFAQLLSDISSLWARYGSVYLQGIANTLILAVTATLIGCIIGFFCGILQTIPYGPNDNILKKILLKLIRIIIRVYVEVFRGTPMILHAVFLRHCLQGYLDRQHRRCFGQYRRVYGGICPRRHHEH